MRSLLLLPAVLMLALPARAADPPGVAPRGLGLLEPTKGYAPAQRVSDPRAAGLLRAPAKTVLPAKWDARDEGWVSPAKDQDPTGACWAFAAPAPAADAPDETDDGTACLADLAATNATLFAETGGSFGASAGLVGANGRSLWTSWLAGFDPSAPDDSALVVSIAISNDVPHLGWTPDLGARRRYTVWGIDALDSADGWRAVDPAVPSATGARFFKVSVGASRDGALYQRK